MTTEFDDQRHESPGPNHSIPSISTPSVYANDYSTTEQVVSGDYKIAGHYVNQADAVKASRFLSAKGYPNAMMYIIDPHHPLNAQLHHLEQKPVSDQAKRPMVRGLMVLGLMITAFTLVGEMDGTLWGSTSLTLGIMGMTTILGASSMLFHGKSIKDLQFEKTISRYARKKYWTVLVYADHKKLARFALRLIERTSCRIAFVSGPAPIK